MPRDHVRETADVVDVSSLPKTPDDDIKLEPEEVGDVARHAFAGAARMHVAHVEALAPRVSNGPNRADITWGRGSIAIGVASVHDTTKVPTSAQKRNVLRLHFVRCGE